RIGQLPNDSYFIEDGGSGIHGTPEQIARLFSIARPMISTGHNASVQGGHSTSLPSWALRTRRIKAAMNRRAIMRPISTDLSSFCAARKSSRCCIRAISGLFLEKFINSPGHQPQGGPVPL